MLASFLLREYELPQCDMCLFGSRHGFLGWRSSVTPSEFGR